MTHGIKDSESIVSPEEVNVGGCRCIRARRYEDDRGYLAVDMQEESTQDAIQVYHSWTLAGMARDADRWHLHVEQMDRFSVLWGKVAFALSDGKRTQIVVLERDQYRLYIPPNVMHCLKAIGPANALILNIPDRLYNTSDEIRVPFDEAGVSAPW